jgi:hypothetical protein
MIFMRVLVGSPGLLIPRSVLQDVGGGGMVKMSEIVRIHSCLKREVRFRFGVDGVSSRLIRRADGETPFFCFAGVLFLDDESLCFILKKN